jgi:hypothetical protein
MKELNGYKGINIDFDSFIRISDLIYFDGPLLSYFIGKNRENYLLYWVDCDELCNRWLVIRTELEEIQLYVDKKITLKKLLLDVFDGVVYVVDIDDNGEYTNCQLVAISDLPEDYTPEDDSWYSFEPTDNIDLNSISQKLHSGILEIHITGSDVNYGSMSLTKFASIIPMFEKLRKASAETYINRIKRNTFAVAKEELILDTEYDYMYSLAGSIRVILKPKNCQLNIEGGEFCTNNFADEYATELTELIASGDTKEQIQKYSKLYSKDVMRRYYSFVDTLSNLNLGVGLSWCNYQNKKFSHAEISRNKVSTYIKNLSSLNSDEVENVEMTGFFYFVNIKSGTYGFDECDEKERSVGKFIATLKEQYTRISFDTKYKVIVKRQRKDPLGGEIKIVDLIISLQVAEE